MGTIDGIEVCALCQAAIPDGVHETYRGSKVCLDCAQRLKVVRPLFSKPWPGTYFLCGVFAFGASLATLGAILGLCTGGSWSEILGALFAAITLSTCGLTLALLRRILLTLEAVLDVLGRDRAKTP